MKTTSVQYHQEPKGRTRQGSFFYDGHVATVSDARYKGIKIIVETLGVKVATIHGKTLKGTDAVAYAIEHNLTDKDIDRLGEEDQLDNTNWFELSVCEGDRICQRGAVIDKLDDAIREAKALIALLRQDYQDNLNPWVCKQCGSTDVEKQVWVRLNTSEITSDVCESNEGRCNDCEEYVRLVQLSNYVPTEKEKV